MKPNDNILIVDRIEGDFAIVQLGEEMIEIELPQIGFDVREGDILRKTPDGYEKDEKGRKERQNTLFKKQQSIFGKR